MGEAVRHHRAAAGALQRIVANPGGCVHGFLHIALLQDLARALGMVGPDAGKAIGLQFEFHAQCVVFNLADASAHLVHLAADAKQVLHMVADFMGDHISLGKVAGGAELGFQGFVKAEVDIHLLVAGTVKRPHGRLTLAAGGLRSAAKQHQPGFPIGAAALGKHVFPDVFGVGQHGGHESGHAVVGRWPLRGGLLLHLRGRRAAAAEHAQKGQRVDAEHPAPHQGHDDGADANAASSQQATTAAKTAAAVAAPVLDVVRFSIAFPFHGDSGYKVVNRLMLSVQPPAYR